MLLHHQTRWTIWLKGRTRLILHQKQTFFWGYTISPIIEFLLCAKKGSFLIYKCPLWHGLTMCERFLKKEWRCEIYTNTFRRDAATFWLLFCDTHSWKPAKSRQMLSGTAENVSESSAIPFRQYFLFRWLPLFRISFRKTHWCEVIFPNVNIAIEKVHFRNGEMFPILLRSGLLMLRLWYQLRQ